MKTAEKQRKTAGDLAVLPIAAPPATQDFCREREVVR
jgi:hypothetical protein